VSQLDSVNRTSRSIDNSGVVAPANAVPSNIGNILPVDSVVKQLCYVNSQPLDSQLTGRTSSKLRATTVNKIQEVS